MGSEMCIRDREIRQERRKTLKKIIPHHFGDHSLCHPRFCGYKCKTDEKYSHRSLPYKSSLKDENLRVQLEKVFEPAISHSEEYSNLGSSQQCEHANREVTLRAQSLFILGTLNLLIFGLLQQLPSSMKGDSMLHR